MAKVSWQHALDGELLPISQHHPSPSHNCKETQALFQSRDVGSGQVSTWHRIYWQYFQEFSDTPYPHNIEGIASRLGATKT